MTVKAIGPENRGAGISRRGLLVAGAGLAGGFLNAPYLNRSGAQAQDATLKFWQFYAPGGDVKPQVKWFQDLVAAWNADHSPKVELEYIVNSEYISGSKLATAFASAV